MKNKHLAHIALLCMSIAIGIAGIYVINAVKDNPHPETADNVSLGAEKSGSGTPLTRREPRAKGDMAAFVVYSKPSPVPDISFVGKDIGEVTLSSWKGKIVLLNIWATWCAPCRKEMPELDRLQGELGSEKFEVVALAVDRSGIAGAKAFFDKAGVNKLKLYADATMRTSSALRVVGMPTTLLIDPLGREIGRLTGPAKWDGLDAKALIGAIVSEHGGHN